MSAESARWNQKPKAPSGMTWWGRGALCPPTCWSSRCTGYEVMQKVTEMSAKTVSVGPGTLYGAFSTLERAPSGARQATCGRCDRSLWRHCPSCVPVRRSGVPRRSVRAESGFPCCQAGWPVCLSRSRLMTPIRCPDTSATCRSVSASRVNRAVSLGTSR